MGDGRRGYVIANGGALRWWRNAKCWTIEELSRRSGVSEGTIGAIEKEGGLRRPRIMRELAGALEVNVAELIIQPPASGLSTAGELAIPRGVLKLDDGLKVLALGAHVDDIELGCGATLLYLKERKNAHVYYVVFCNHYEEPLQLVRTQEAKDSVELMGIDGFELLDYRDTELPDAWRLVQFKVKALRITHEPDLIFAPRVNDNHQDHVVIGEAAQREFRQGQALWHYEMKQFGQDLFDANIFVDVSGCTGRADSSHPQYAPEYRDFLAALGSSDESRGAAPDTYAHLKAYVLRKAMTSQRTKPFMHPELILGTMRIRGMQGSPNVGFAEAFRGRTFIPHET